MSCRSRTESPSAVLVLQSIMKASDVWVTCATSVMRGLLLAVYVEALAAGQVGDAGVVGAGVMDVMSAACVTVIVALLALIADALLDREREMSI